ncbi:unnamed protein product [Adineta steineri]|uniref:G-protein coupled receptors family 1 profile domain-containing protein n=1 Tax=Adineta steineri TaxID=433720 RepID=A0A813PZY3_9BILA|nr:unnamed protein product [Adineta steineri]CAF3941391.1 unnamed protein product [Adineta steineri]
MSVSLNDVSNWMTQYIMSIFLVVGILGNVINIYMFTRKESFRNSCSLYLLAASILNILSIIWGICPSLYTLYNTDPSTYSFIYCKLRLYTLHTLLMIGRSLMVFACADRYALCSRSARLRSFCEPKLAIKLIIAHIFVWPILTVHIVFLENFTGHRCAMLGSNDLIYGLYSTVIAGILPPLLMSIFSILTIRHRRELIIRLNAARINNKRDTTFMIMLLSQVIVYVLTTCLYPTVTLYRAITGDQTKSTERLQIESFLAFLSGSFLIYLNPASAFYVYFIVAKNFRKDCKLAFIRLYKRITGERRRVQPTIAQVNSILPVNHAIKF